MILDHHQMSERLLHLILQQADLEQIEVLLRKSSTFDYNRLRYDGQSLIHLCCLYNRLDLLKCLINSGQCDLFLVNRDGWLPIHLAIYLGHRRLVRYLLELMTNFCR